MTVTAYSVLVTRPNVTYYQTERCLERYKWRHDSVLLTLSHHFNIAVRDHNAVLFVDCEALSFPSPESLFESQRPDLVIVNGSQVYVLELTCCYEKNTTKSREYKKGRYERLRKQLLILCTNFHLFCFEITTMGFISSASFNELDQLRKLFNASE